MAELELSVKYETLPNKLGFYLMAALLPVWSLVIPFILGLLIAHLMLNPQAITNPLLTLEILLFLAAVPILGVLLTAFFEDNRIYISKNGISFPLHMAPELGFRRMRSWSELQGAGISRSLLGKAGNFRFIHLNFGKTLPLKFRLKNFNKVQLEQMLLALELWSGKSVRSPELIEFQNSLHNENKGLGRLSQMEVWEEELSRRFSATSFVPLEPGRKILDGSLEIVRQLAFGGLSAIYLAQQDKKNMVVLKEAVVPSNADEETREKAAEHFFREAQLLMTLKHPNIARVLSSFSFDGRDYMLLQYVQGQDLRQLIKQQGPQPELRVVEWALQISGILKYLQEQNPPIVHRDLTPDNLLLDKDGNLILIDFGAANQFVGSATGTLVGKQSYMAPEQLRGRASPVSDIYSFAGSLYYLLTGADPLPLAESHPRESNINVSADFDGLIAEMSAFEEEERLCDVEEIITRLGKIRARIMNCGLTQESSI